MSHHSMDSLAPGGTPTGCAPTSGVKFVISVLSRINLMRSINLNLHISCLVNQVLPAELAANLLFHGAAGPVFWADGGLPD